MCCFSDCVHANAEFMPQMPVPTGEETGESASLLGSCGDPVFDDIVSGYEPVVLLTRAEASKMVVVKLTH